MAIVNSVIIPSLESGHQINCRYEKSAFPRITKEPMNKHEIKLRAAIYSDDWMVPKRGTNNVPVSAAPIQAPK